MKRWYIYRDKIIFKTKKNKTNRGSRGSYEFKGSEDIVKHVMLEISLSRTRPVIW